MLPAECLINGWIDSKYLPEGEDKYYLRRRQAGKADSHWRHLTSDEIERLIKNDNTASSWDTIWVTDEFVPRMLKNNRFYGTVRIGRVQANGLQFHDLRLPVGITNSSIHSCDIGDDCAIHDVHYMSHYIIGDRCMLFNIAEMTATDHSKFGNGIIKDGEDEKVRVKLYVMNENEGREVYPFDGMTTADAYLWAKYADDTELKARLGEITQSSFDAHRGYYGTVGNDCVIKTSSIIKDAKIGESCYIKGASKLKNITINSSAKEPSQIGENVILVNGIVGYNCRIFYSCIAVKFIIGNNCNIKYGARVINSILGDNSTISCCEVLNNLIFPAHEQHHNNSFLIAAVVMGQSNIAAGATLGSNHNSRTPDNEIVAGRGFWPGLCSSIKQSSRFATFNLLAKGSYSKEINNPFPFALIANDEVSGELHVMPAYWWQYNMFALARNNWKFQHRDKRVTKVQNIEFETFAPDSMQEVSDSRKVLLSKLAEGRDVFCDEIENGKRRVRIIKPEQAVQSYSDMLVHYLMTNVLKQEGKSLSAIGDECRGSFVRDWVNMGGQLMKESDLEDIKAGIKSGRLADWDSIHTAYDECWKRYPADKLAHAYGLVCDMLGVEELGEEQWKYLTDEEIRIQKYICDGVYSSRRKDDLNPFRRATYRSDAEMEAVVGNADTNDFVLMIREETASSISALKALRFK